MRTILNSLYMWLIRRCLTNLSLVGGARKRASD
jgi:hypothetical protein